MPGPQAAWLSPGRRLHLQHGPIDLIVAIEGPGADGGFERAHARFQTILDDLAANLPTLRSRAPVATTGLCATALRMVAAVAPYANETFVTPMAAVAGSVADEMLAAITSKPDTTRASVNNGGDIAFYLAPGTAMRAALAALPGCIADLDARTPARGLATSGWRGRSHSFGIADAVTVAAPTAAGADVAATLIANAVDLPGSAKITRQPACDLSPDSDLGDRHVTVAVAPLTSDEVAAALRLGVAVAHAFADRGLISAALLQLGDEAVVVGDAVFGLSADARHRTHHIAPLTAA
ncbi:MAG: UPF0280 family protein [Pseudomonadota bacterium]